MASTAGTGAGAGGNASMMKEYLKKQLKYWVENFRDDMLPRDFGSKSFSRNTLTLHKIELKLHKVATMLQIPAPLLVTRAYCSEVVIKVPSWSAADKFMQEPLSFRVVDLFVDVKSAADCDEAYRKAADARVQAAIMEPDPLGSIASWYAFSTIISERLELVVDNIYVKVFSRGVSRIRLELTRFHSRTTNAMWQDMRDLTTCVDRSPDGLLKTRFKFVSFSCSVLLTQAEGSDATAPPLQILHDHEVTLRMTLFGHHQSKSQSWETLSQVIDVNLHTLPFDYEIEQLLQIYQVYLTVSGWIREAAAAAEERAYAARATGSGGTGLQELLQHYHQVQRGQIMDKKRATTKDSEEEKSETEASFALQLTFRFTADAKVRFVSERLGKQFVSILAQHAAINVIVHHDDVRELQVTVHEVSVHFQDALVLFLKPSRDVMQLKQLRESVFVKWHLHKLACAIEGDLALVLNEAYHARSEKEQSAFIKCGTCAQQIRLESIETHVCGPAVRSPTSSIASSNAGGSRLSDAQSRQRASLGNSNLGSPDPSHDREILDSTTMPRLRVVFALDELELNIDSHLFHNVQQLMRSSASAKTVSELVERKFAVSLKELSMTTEAKEFVGDAIFVPVLPLAFQMLECALQGCGCIHSKTKTKPKAATDECFSSSKQSLDGDSSLPSSSPSSRRQSPWPNRVFVELAHMKCTATSPQQHNHQNTLESFFTADTISLRSSFSDGQQICVNSHPQLSLHASVSRVRCQVDHPAFQFIRKAVISQTQSGGSLQSASIIAQTLFLAVLEIRTIEFTLLEAGSSVSSANAARLKNLFKQVNIVGDNQLGYLALQSSLDFRSLLNSQFVRFFHRKEKRKGSSSGTSSSLFGVPEDLANANKKMAAAASVISNFVKNTHQHLESEVVGLATHSKESAARLMLPSYSVCKKMLGLHDTPSSDKEQQQQKKKSGDALSPKGKEQEVRGADAESEPARRNGSAASSSRSLTMEMTESAELAHIVTREREQRLESRSRSEAQDHVQGEGENCDAVLGGNGAKPGSKSPRESECEDDGGDFERDDEHAGARENELEREVEDDGNGEEEEAIDDQTAESSVHEAEFGLDEALLARLPDVMRVLVQIDEHRVRVPINPREKVGFLCREIVRRYNEIFATSSNSGFISHVALQDARGGVFAAMDVVGFVCTSESEVFFALPYKQDSRIRSVAHIESLPLASSGSAQPLAKRNRGRKIKQVGSKFSRCSQLPLPLVIALLANESERDLVRCVLSDGSFGTNGSGGKQVDEWPELVLNVSFLNPQSILPVEVRWFGNCLEVTNVDAFVLCLQQLGLCTSRASSKYVGKILRDRLKMDAKNPFISAACLRSHEFEMSAGGGGDGSTTREEAGDGNAEGLVGVSYASLKEIVQEDFGIYTASSSSKPANTH